LCSRNCTRPVPRSPAKQHLFAAGFLRRLFVLQSQQNPSRGSSHRPFVQTLVRMSNLLRLNLCTMQFSRFVPFPRPFFTAFARPSALLGGVFFIIRPIPARCQFFFCPALAFFNTFFQRFRSSRTRSRWAASCATCLEYHMPRPLSSAFLPLFVFPIFPCCNPDVRRRHRHQIAASVAAFFAIFLYAADIISFMRFS
jgi:hypothetical protein